MIRVKRVSIEQHGTINKLIGDGWVVRGVENKCRIVFTKDVPEQVWESPKGGLRITATDNKGLRLDVVGPNITLCPDDVQSMVDWLYNLEMVWYFGDDQEEKNG